jgi:hypothetical protein
LFDCLDHHNSMFTPQAFKQKLGNYISHEIVHTKDHKGFRIKWAFIPRMKLWAFRPVHCKIIAEL